MYWAKNCQHKCPRNANIVQTKEEEETDSEYEVEDINFVLMTTQNPRKDFIAEMIPKAVIDTVSTKTVAGELCLHNFMKNLDDTSLNHVEITKSHKVFKFGDTHKVIATSKAKLPCFTRAEIVKQKIPLLLSKKSLKEAGTVLYFQNNNIKMFNEDMEVTTSNNGHYAINILLDKTRNFDSIEQVLIFEEDKSNKSKIQKIIKLHKQFGQASSGNLEKILKRAGIPLSNIGGIISKVVSLCKMCQQYKKPVPRPTIGLPKANDFNKMVVMDLHKLAPNLWYLH